MTACFGGSFLTPRNLWTLLVQTSSIAVMSTGMVLVIVMRQIDLSVGSMLSLVAVATGVLQVYHLGPVLGVGHPIIWIIAVVACLGAWHADWLPSTASLDGLCPDPGLHRHPWWPDCL